MKRCFLLALFFLLPASCVEGEDLFDSKPVADGVYAAIAKPTYSVNSNAAIIFLGDGVLVVDANSTPSAARSLIEQIKKLTHKPVKYVVNTHFHADHTQGNEAYPNAWPAGVENNLVGGDSRELRAARHPALEARNRRRASRDRTVEK
jgi:glyoxylase-like metal-dependent hydrolase (beta-lactamase superfamily II)